MIVPIIQKGQYNHCHCIYKGLVDKEKQVLVRDFGQFLLKWYLLSHVPGKEVRHF